MGRAVLLPLITLGSTLDVDNYSGGGGRTGGQSATRYLTIHQTALRASRKPIFLPWE